MLAAGLKTNAAAWYFTTATAGALLTALYMGRALHLLRKNKQGKAEKVNSIWYMRTGMALLVAVVLAGGFFLKPAVKFIHLEMPHATAAIVAGIAAAVLGLATGWLFLSRNFKSKMAAFIRNNYSIAGGYEQLVVVPVLKLAQLCARVETGIDAAVQLAGSFFYALSKNIYRLDKIVEYFVQLVGGLNLQIARFTRLSDDSGIHRAVQFISQGIKELGVESRKLQNGLIHREMLWTIIGFIGFILILIGLNL